PRVRGPPAQGVLRGGCRLQGVRLLPHRQQLRHQQQLRADRIRFREREQGQQFLLRLRRWLQEHGRQYRGRKLVRKLTHRPLTTVPRRRERIPAAFSVCPTKTALWTTPKGSASRSSVVSWPTPTTRPLTDTATRSSVS